MERKFTVIIQNLGSKLSEASLVPSNRVTKLELTVFVSKTRIQFDYFEVFPQWGVPFRFSQWIGYMAVFECDSEGGSLLVWLLHYIASFFQRKIAFANHEFRHRLARLSISVADWDVDGQNLIFKTIDSAMQIFCLVASLCWVVDIAISWGIDLFLKTNLINSKEMNSETISVVSFAAFFWGALRDILGTSKLFWDDPTRKRGFLSHSSLVSPPNVLLSKKKTELPKVFFLTQINSEDPKRAKDSRGIWQKPKWTLHWVRSEGLQQACFVFCSMAISGKHFCVNNGYTHFYKNVEADLSYKLSKIFRKIFFILIISFSIFLFFKWIV